MMETNDAVLRCLSCGATLDVAAESGPIAEEAFWHRRHFHQELAEVDFITRLPWERAASALTVSAGQLAEEQARSLEQWDARIAGLIAAA